MKQYRKSYLIESPEGTNFKPARRYLEKEFGIQYNEAMQLFGKLKNEFNGVRGLDSKYMLGLVRMYKNGELEGTIGEEPNEKSIASLVNQCLGIVTEEPYASKLDQDLNGMTALQFIEAFQDKVEAAGNADKDKLSQQDFGGNNGYDIVLIDSFEKAEEYAKYTTWCVTESERAYNNYTKGGTFYFCLKKGFESIPKEEGDNAPLDAYGLSMIAVSIYPDGSCNTITSRWNNGDKVMTTEELSKVIGENFYDVFKPVRRTLTLGGREYVIGVTEDGDKALYDEEGVNVVGDNVINYEKNNKLTEFLGCDVLFVEKSFGKNFLKFQAGKDQYLFDEWFHECWCDSGLSQQLGVPCFCTEINQWQNYIIFKDGKAQYLLGEWVDHCYYNKNLSEQLGAPCFELTSNWKENCIIFKDGRTQYLLDMWLNKCAYNNGLSRQLGIPCFIVVNEEKVNYAIFKGNKMQCLFDKWYDECKYDDFLSKRLGTPCFGVRNEYGCNYAILRDGKTQYLFDEWYDECQYDHVLSRRLDTPCFGVRNGDDANIAMYKNSEIQYLFNEWVKQDDLGTAKEEYLRQLRQRNENRAQHISMLITEVVMKKLR